MRLDASCELIGAEGLDDVVVGAEAEAANLVDFLLTCRDHEDRRVFFPADGAADGEAVRTWQHEVEQDEVEVFGERLFFALFAVGDDFHGKVVGFEVVALKLCNRFVVLDDQDAFHASPLLSSVVSSCRGRVILRMSPPVGFASARIVPWHAQMISRAMASPKPLPLLVSVRARSVR